MVLQKNSINEDIGFGFHCKYRLFSLIKKHTTNLYVAKKGTMKSVYL